MGKRMRMDVFSGKRDTYKENGQTGVHKSWQEDDSYCNDEKHTAVRSTVKIQVAPSELLPLQSACSSLPAKPNGGNINTRVNMDPDVNLLP